MPTARRCLLIVPAALVLWMLACSSSDTKGTSGAADGGDDAGDDSASPEDAGADGDAAKCALHYSYGSNDCNTCMQTACCAELATCEADPTCASLQKCVLDCMNVVDAGGCRNECLAAQPDGGPRKSWDAVELCWFRTEEPAGCHFDCTYQP